MVVFCEHRNKDFGFKSEEFLDHPRNYELLEKDSIPWSQFNWTHVCSSRSSYFIPLLFSLLLQEH